MIKSSQMIQENVRVRFAPSPTGIPHVGNIRTALFDYFFAKANNGTFILRIEDTDQARKVEGAEDAIQESLRWLGADWDEYMVQSQRLDEYKTRAYELVEKGLAKEEEGAIRFLALKEGSTSWTDLVGDKKISFDNKDIEDFIILKKDGFPTYHFANVVDDHLTGITHVIRGEDWIPSAPKHLMLYKAFLWEPPLFAHVPNVLGVDHKKLSKRKGAKSVLDYKKEGILPEALLNFLMLLGWSPKNDQEILSKKQIETEFNFKNVNTAPAVFDEKKLFWMNGEYIRQLKISDLKSKILDFDSSLSSISNIDTYLELAQTRMKTLSDFKELVQSNDVVIYSDDQKKLAERLIADLQTIEWEEEEISNAILKARDGLNLKTKDVFTVLSGRAQGLPFQSKVFLDGRDKTIEFLTSHL